MLMRTDPFRELDRMAQQLMGPGTWSKPSVMPMGLGTESADAQLLQGMRDSRNGLYLGRVEVLSTAGPPQRTMRG